MARFRLHGPGMLAAAILFAVSPRARGAATPACPGIAGDSVYSDDLAKFSRQRGSLCGREATLKKILVAPLWRKLQICGRFAQYVGVAWSPDPFEALAKRYDEACENWDYYLPIATHVCDAYSKEAAKPAPSLPEDASGLEALRAADSRYSHAACISELLRNLSWESHWVGKLAGRTGNPPSKATTDARFTEQVTELRSQLQALGPAVQRKFAAMPAATVAQVRDTWAICQQAPVDLSSFEEIYQKQIFAGIIVMHRDAVNASSFFGDRFKTYGDMDKTLRDRIGKLGEGEATTSEGTLPILVKPDSAAPGGASAEFCPAESSLTPTERTLRENVRYLTQSGTKMVGTSFIANTTDAAGVKHNFEFSAAHGAMTDFHNPDSQEMAALKTAPAGRVYSATDAGQYENSPEQLDRQHDIVVRPTGFGPGIPVKADKADPQLGQEFELAGHPVDGYGQSYVNMTCTFAGYGTGNVEGYYALQCPAEENSLGGVSGGPLVDKQTGQVWGVATNQGGYYDANGYRLGANNMVFVSPLQQDAAGSVVLGPQGYHGSSACYDIGSVIPKPCYLTPNGTSYP